MSDLTGRCACGAVQYRAAPEILWAGFCHCEDCRRAASTDYASWLGVKRATVEWTGPRKIYRSSSQVERSHCGECGSPLSFETQAFADETHLYATSLDTPSLYQPTAHIYWSERLPWIDSFGSLPTYEKGIDASTVANRQ